LGADSQPARLHAKSAARPKLARKAVANRNPHRLAPNRYPELATRTCGDTRNHRSIAHLSHGSPSSAPHQPSAQPPHSDAGSGLTRTENIEHHDITGAHRSAVAHCDQIDNAMVVAGQFPCPQDIAGPSDIRKIC